MVVVMWWCATGATSLTGSVSGVGLALAAQAIGAGATPITNKAASAGIYTATTAQTAVGNTNTYQIGTATASLATDDYVTVYLTAGAANAIFRVSIACNGVVLTGNAANAAADVTVATNGAIVTKIYKCNTTPGITTVL